LVAEHPDFTKDRVLSVNASAIITLAAVFVIGSEKENGRDNPAVS